VMPWGDVSGPSPIRILKRAEGAIPEYLTFTTMPGLADRADEAAVRDPAAMAGSGDKQTQPKLCRVEINEFAVAFDPPAGCEVITEAVHCPRLGVRPDSGPD
jgi:hypothetical protein